MQIRPVPNKQAGRIIYSVDSQTMMAKTTNYVQRTQPTTGVLGLFWFMVGRVYENSHFIPIQFPVPF